MSKTFQKVYLECFALISANSQPFWVKIGPLERSRVSKPLPVPAVTRTTNPQGLQNPCHSLNIEPSPFDRFDVFKQILIPSPANKYLSNQPRTSRIRTTPAIKPKGRKPGTPARFDTALIAEDISKHHQFGGLESIQN